MTADLGRIPATIVTGFLGAGKTTLIRHLLQNAGGRRIALIVNEFGDVGFDGSVLAECGSEACGGEEIIELANGCICCTVADDFLPAMETILGRGEPPDHIVIETSGLALPQPLVKAFTWPTVRNRVTVDAVVTVVDATAVAEGRVASDEAKLAEQRAKDLALDHDDPVEELFEDQLRCADLILVSKTDLVSESDLARVEAAIDADRRPEARTVRVANGAVPAEILLGQRAAAEADVANRKSHHELEGEEHDHDDFDTFVLAVEASDRAAIEARVRGAMALPGVLRIKGLVTVPGRAAPLAVQAVGPRVETWFVPEAGRPPGLVVIGLRSLDRAAVEAALGS
ncbi:cobalamin biosynthesis protein CobW [Propylenella binzhouense]|uniref:Cobalamin biosynthesis protein CobW n=1 Tax=Propylenella binzhouense TaxID=2555902 RepID=A0A964T6P0_9HYPH|nr:cobalamin biosynthesis protein CobW [Propylenella binzhouense]MYZ49483.1 cobalamin biosynthesis protein CobW [Propylenella binzhouense]